MLVWTARVFEFRFVWVVVGNVSTGMCLGEVCGRRWEESFFRFLRVAVLSFSVRVWTFMKLFSNFSSWQLNAKGGRTESRFAVRIWLNSSSHFVFGIVLS